jgi:hypothetical protein
MTERRGAVAPGNAAQLQVAVAFCKALDRANCNLPHRLAYQFRLGSLVQFDRADCRPEARGIASWQLDRRNDSANTCAARRQGRIYGFDPNGTQKTATTILAKRVAAGLNQPDFAGAPKGDTGRLFIVEKEGVIKILDTNTGQVLATPFLDIQDEVDAGGEKGLLGLAFDPDFANNGFFYVDMINNAGDTEIRRYHISGDPNVADEASMTKVLTIDQPNLGNHKAGWIDFGPDGKLYIATGEGGGGGDPNNNGQTINTLLGKMLRIDVSGDDFPADPIASCDPERQSFVGQGADEIWAPACNQWQRFRPRPWHLLCRCRAEPVEEIDIRHRRHSWLENFRGPEALSGTPTAGTLQSDPPTAMPRRDRDRRLCLSRRRRGLQGQYLRDFGTGHYSPRQVGQNCAPTSPARSTPILARSTPGLICRAVSAIFTSSILMACFVLPARNRLRQ